jgi:hypothetical protein
MENSALKKAPHQCGGFPFYLRTPDAPIVGAAPGTPIGAKVLPKALPTAGTLGRGAAGPVFLHVGTTFVEPTVAGYEPTEGATTDPYPAVPSACASANVLVSVKAVASAIVVTFMRCPLLSSDRRQPHRLLDRSAKIFVRRDRSRQAVHISQSLRCSSNRRPSRVIRLRRCSIAPGYGSSSPFFPTMVQEFP